MSTINFITLIVIPLLSASLGALLAFRYQSKMELKREKRLVIQTLMMYRNVRANELDWIKVLNAVDIVFHDETKVRALYHTFIHQVTPPLFSNSQWLETFFNMLLEMCHCSGYKKITLQDIRDYYAPNALNNHYPSMNLNTKPSIPNPEDLP